MSEAERAQIASAAARLEKTTTGFIREAALEASARVARRVSVVTEPPASEAEIAFVDAEDEHRQRLVDGEWVARRRDPRDAGKCRVGG